MEVWRYKGICHGTGETDPIHLDDENIEKMGL